jgi:hypothetical protein
MKLTANRTQVIVALAGVLVALLAALCGKADPCVTMKDVEITNGAEVEFRCK